MVKVVVMVLVIVVVNVDDAVEVDVVDSVLV